MAVVVVVPEIEWTKEPMQVDEQGAIEYTNLWSFIGPSGDVYMRERVYELPGKTYWIITVHRRSDRPAVTLYEGPNKNAATNAVRKHEAYLADPLVIMSRALEDG